LIYHHSRQPCEMRVWPLPAHAVFSLMIADKL
jgi:hypothetical protein